MEQGPGFARCVRAPEPEMFLFFSNRLGWIASLLISAGLTALVLLLLGVF